MDSLFKDMDFLVKHWAAFSRQFPAPCQVLSIGDVKAKDHWVRKSFGSCNFSLILKGRGEFVRKGRVWPVQAPFMLTQAPGDHLRYGPFLPETWDELYLIYEAKCLPWFRQRGFMDANRPVWPVQNVEGVQAQVNELRALFHHPRPETTADRIDRIAERLILESLLPGPKVDLETNDELIQTLALQLQRKPQEAPDFEGMARRHGLSHSTLRRRWSSALQTTPGRYLLELRIRNARRLLAETSLQIGEIAVQTGFQDVLYFSRRFKLETALTPSQYRRRYRIKQS